MKKKELLRQLNNLQNKILPNQTWKEKSREILHAQIIAQTSELDSNKLSKVLAQKFAFTILRPVAMTFAILIAVSGIWAAGVGATKNSLPGDLLWGLKLTGERLQVNLALNDEKKTNLEMSFAGLRLDEAKKVMSRTNDKSKLELPLKKYQENMANVKSNLAKLEMTDKGKALKLADMVDRQASVYVDLLRSDEIKSDSNTTDAIIVSKATGDKALSVMLNEFESGSEDVSLDELKLKLSERIEGLKKDNEGAKTDIQTIIDNKAKAEELAKAEAAKAKAEAEAAAKVEAEKKQEDAATAIDKTKTTTTEADKEQSNSNANTNTNSGTDLNTNSNVNLNTNSNTNINSDISALEPEAPVEVLPTIEEMKDKPAQIEKLLAKAEEYLKSNSVSQAFVQVNQADDILSTINKVIDANSQYLVAPVENQEADKPADSAKVEAIETETKS
ncbi:MAG: DUF5667 domain-containing protein [Patescibacteria group bacterium]|nr:DUF5667 domain-containing protein [Patescibacteria group bacterium]